MLSQVDSASDADIKDVHAVRSAGNMLFNFIESIVTIDKLIAEETNTDVSVVNAVGGKVNVKDALVDFFLGSFLDSEDTEVEVHNSSITSRSEFTFRIRRGYAILENSNVDQRNGEYAMASPLLVEGNPK